MALLDHNGESEFPFSKNKVFDALCIVIPSISGLKVESADRLIGRILVKGGVSLASWGENIPIQLTEISENKTRIQITSTPKTGIMMGGAFDMGKNRKNIENILNATSGFLSNGYDRNSNVSHLPQQVIVPKKKLTFGKGVLYGFLGFLGIGILSAMFGKEETVSTEKIATEQIGTSVDVTPAEDNVKVDSEEEEVLAKLKADWPDDYSTQEYWVKTELEDYRYMKEVPAGSLKSKVQRDWPLDFSTQKYWYS
ncbi:hypothetical protein [Pedobacter sp. FW305-3-2-15-E-R2A2]|uniref:hypothetical protein n=1 Tax=Pedobacter sp. FW305-3-2-15-E-R2A2 TaxID=3140251 RepID=UPI0031409CA3